MKWQPLKCKPPGLAVQCHGRRWYAYWHRPCQWSLGRTSDVGEAHPFRIVAELLEDAAQPCQCGTCKPVAMIGGGD